MTKAISARIVIITGAPATGKTSLGRFLGQAIHVPVIERDSVKETLADVLPRPTAVSRELLGSMSYAVLWYTVSAIVQPRRPVIIEGTFDRMLGSVDLKTLCRAWPIDVLQIHCTAPQPVVLRRFRRRMHGGRHRIHNDERQMTTLRGALASGRWGPLETRGTTIIVDTSRDAANLKRALLKLVRNHLEELPVSARRRA